MALPPIVVPRTLRQPKPQTDYFGSFTQGFQFGNGIRRQRALDEMARQKMEQDAIFQRAVQERLSKQHDESMQLQRSAQTRLENQDRAAIVEKARAALLDPAETLEKDPEVAAAVAPILKPGRDAANLIPTAPSQTPAGMGVLRPEVAEKQGLQWGKPELSAVYDESLSKASAKANDIFGQRAQDKRAQQDAMHALARDRVDNARDRMEMLTPEQTKELIGTENTVRNVDRLSSKAKELAASGKYPGLYGMKVNQAAKYLEGQDVDASVLNAMITGTLADYIFQVSGKAVTEQEFARLRQVTANQDDTFQVAVAKLDQFRRFMADRKQDMLRGYELQGKRVDPGWRSSDYAGKPAAGSAPSTFTPDAG